MHGRTGRVRKVMSLGSFCPSRTCGGGLAREEAVRSAMGVPGHEVIIEPKPYGAQVRFVSAHRLNPLTRGLVARLLAAAGDIAADPPAVVIFRGAENFSCGAHTGELRAMSRAELSAFIAEELALCEAVARLPCLTIAAIQGVCIGNAAELALSCDLRVASEDASFAWPEVTLGHPAPVGRLAQYVGRGPAAQLALLGERVTAARAYQIGLVTDVGDTASLDERLARLAERAASLPRQAVLQTRTRLEAAYSH